MESIAKKIFIVLMLLSCKSTPHLVLKNGKTPIPINESFFKNKNKFNKNLLNQIDTNCFYRELYIEDGWEYLIKFYSNGCVNKFYFEKGKEIKADFFNPEINGLRGVLYMNYDSLVKIDMFCAITPNRFLGIRETQIIVLNDSIIIEKFKGSYIDIKYQKVKVDSSFLKYKANW